MRLVFKCRHNRITAVNDLEMLNSFIWSIEFLNKLWLTNNNSPEFPQFHVSYLTIINFPSLQNRLNFTAAHSNKTKTIIQRRVALSTLHICHISNEEQKGTICSTATKEQESAAWREGKAPPRHHRIVSCIFTFSHCESRSFRSDIMELRIVYSSGSLSSSSSSFNYLPSRCVRD